MSPHPEQEAPSLAGVLASIRRRPCGRVEAGLAKTIRSETDALVILDQAHKIALLNRQAERIFGCEQEQLLGQPWQAAFPERLNLAASTSCEDVFTTMRRTGPACAPDCSSTRGTPVHVSISRYQARGTRFTVLTLREWEQHKKIDNRGENHKIDRRKLAASYQRVCEDEKKHLFGKLHDDLAQRLSVLKLDLDWLERSFWANPELIPERLQQMQLLLDDSIAATKRIAADLSPPLLDDFGLKPAIEWAAGAFQKKTAILCQLECRNLRTDIQSHIAFTVFRVVQECLLNIEKHARATKVSIVLGCMDPDLKLTIQDNGIGIPAWPKNSHDSHGLNAIQERIYILGGAINIYNIVPHGLAIDASVPLWNSPHFSL